MFVLDPQSTVHGPQSMQRTVLWRRVSCRI